MTVGMEIEQTSLRDVLILKPRKHGDDRGFFSEVFRHDLFAKATGGISFVQENHSLSAKAATLRGMHFQLPPRSQGKLVRVTRGAALDAVVDVRQGSPTYGRHILVELSEQNWRQLWIPSGFLHGFLTLTDHVEFLYKVTDYYSAEHDRTVAFNDPDLAIQWPDIPGGPIVSDKDRNAPRLKDLGHLFSYEGY